MPQPFPSPRLCYCASPRRASESTSFLLEWDYCQEHEIYGAKRRPNKIATAQQFGCCFPGLSVFSHMSCKLEYVNRSQLPSGNTKSALLTRALFRELTDPLWPGRTLSPTRDLGVRAGHPGSPEQGASANACMCVSHQLSDQKRTQERRKPEAQAFWILSAIPVLLQVLKQVLWRHTST